ncbi:MAG TPA: hypothetical protein VME45_14925 [Stellaceae bacterium]|nr:hypothetical protein [Stellaceae bacterium]
MRPLLFVAVCVLALVFSGAGAEAAWFCEPLHAYYPEVRSCPIPWRTADPQSGAQRLTVPPASNAADDPAPAHPTSRTQTPQTEATQGDQPTFPAPSSFVRGDVLDQWCRGSTTALLTAICGDDKLRDLAVQRLYAFEEAKGRLNPDQQKTLIADQNNWALSYPQTCGLNADVQPSLPLAPPLHDCLEKAGRARLQYLKDYGLPDAEKTATAPPEAAAPAPPAPAMPAPATPSPVTPSQGGTTSPTETQSPATTGASPTPAAASPNNEAQPPAKALAPSPRNNAAHQSATATIPPAATPAKPAPSDVGSPAAPHPHSSLSTLANFTRTGAMLIAVIVLAIWLIAVWLRSRRVAGTGETRERRQ